MNKIEEQMTIYMKVQKLVRLPMSEMSLKKSGYNKHLNYYYYELGDFLKQATKLLADAGLCTVFNISYDNNGIEIATLTVTDGLEKIVFTTPTADVPNMQGVFNLGSKHTYCKRYLYVNLLDLTENDPGEQNNDGQGKVEEKKATKKQVEIITNMYDEENITKMLAYYGAAKLEDLTISQASEAISRKAK
jgi:hypothetical protein